MKRQSAFLPAACVLTLIGLLSAYATVPAVRAAETPTLVYNRDIRPILSENCFACHGPDRNKRQAGLRLDVREEAVGHKAIVPGKPQESKLMVRVLSADADTQMPPAASHKQLTAAQKETLRRWITTGATYQAHWAYMPPVRPAVPKIAPRPGWIVRNPIDAFILDTLRQKRMSPSAPADRVTLLRRVTLDLTGLPPTMQEMQAFLADTSPTAYEKAVDRLLASPRYGERMAVPWLDLVRYADTVGFHGDQNQNAWAYRDYVVAAFNTNKPFDQFTREQLAGDLLPNPTPAQLTASCYNRLNMMTREGGAQPKEYLAKYAADRVRTVAMTWMGSTMGCCECHDHKYDPFKQRDFYAMESFFADIKQWGVYADYGYTPNPDLRGYTNDHPFPPEIKVQSSYLQQRIVRAQNRMQTIAAQTGPQLQKDSAALAAYRRWLTEGIAFLDRHPDGWETPNPEGAAPTQSDFRAESDGSVLLTGKAAASVEMRLHPAGAQIAALRLELLPHAQNGGSVFRTGRKPGMLTLTAGIRTAAGKVRPVSFRYASATYAEPRYASGFELLGVQRGWKIAADRPQEARLSIWLPDVPFQLAPDETLVLTFPEAGVGCLRASVSPFAPDTPDALTLPPTLRRTLNQPDALVNQTDALRAYLRGTGWNREAFAQIKAAEADIEACRQGWTPVMVTAATTPTLTRVLPRGNWQDETGAVVAPSVPTFLPGSSSREAPRQTRLDLADWIMAPDNPLTARVFVNRLWKQCFGNGLSAQTEDLGAQGEWPTHPELLDWLAVEFRDSGWNVKKMVKLLVTSATYRQSSSLRPEIHERDPNNRLLTSQNPRRLEAEFVRDNALAIAGLLNLDLGGPPCKPYQPAGYYVNIQFPDRSYVADTDERQYRRGLYMHRQRTFEHPMLANFDAPSREDCVASRTNANTPQQALTLLNDPTFVEAARVLAADLLKAKQPTDAAGLTLVFRRALARAPKPQEQQSLLAFLQKMRAAYRERPQDAPSLLKVGNAPVETTADPIELAAWTSVCRVLLNLNETITRY
jgi:mono/diheme cytochrome c family protein